MARVALAPAPGWSHLADRLAARLAEPPSAALPPARPFAPFEGRCALGAVDGSSSLVLDGDGLAVGAVRTAALAWRAHAPVSEEVSDVELCLLDEDLAEELASALPGHPPADGPAALLDRLRALREAEAALRLARALAPGDVLALDGPLAQRDVPPALRQALARAAADRGVALAGVAKSTAATLHGRPALLAAARAARGVPEPWMVPLPGGAFASWAVRFLRGGHVFRVDIAGEAAEVALGKLAPWTRDAGYPGYPYPLALAHNRCTLDEALAQDLAHVLRGLAAQRGVDAASWEEVFTDFHDVLDRGT